MEPKLNINLNVNAVNIILNALGQRPFAEVAQLIAEIKQQAEAQLQQPAPAVEPSSE